LQTGQNVTLTIYPIMPVYAFPAARMTPERVVNALQHLSPAPMILPRLQRLLTNPNSGLFEIVELVKLDSALTARVIQVSNSAWFGRGASCQTIEDAVNRVGFHQVHRLVATAAVSTVVGKALTVYGLDDKAMWRDSVACAFAAEFLAAHIREDVAEAYTIGLLHLVGRVAIDNHLRAKRPVIQLTEENFPNDFNGAERTQLGFCQADVGSCMLKRWDFGPLAIEALRSQYTPLEALLPYDRMAAVLYGARLLRTIVCHDGEGLPIRADAAVLEILRMTETELLGLVPDLRAQMTKAKQITEMR
jgi:HD-like signal output (HDOD) protein